MFLKYNIFILGNLLLTSNVYASRPGACGDGAICQITAVLVVLAIIILVPLAIFDKAKTKKMVEKSWEEKKPILEKIMSFLYKGNQEFANYLSTESKCECVNIFSNKKGQRLSNKQFFGKDKIISFLSKEFLSGITSEYQGHLTTEIGNRGGSGILNEPVIEFIVKGKKIARARIEIESTGKILKIHIWGISS